MLNHRRAHHALRYTPATWLLELLQALPSPKRAHLYHAHCQTVPAGLPYQEHRQVVPVHPNEVSRNKTTVKKWFSSKGGSHLLQESKRTPNSSLYQYSEYSMRSGLLNIPAAKTIPLSSTDCGHLLQKKNTPTWSCPSLRRKPVE